MCHSNFAASLLSWGLLLQAAGAAESHGWVDEAASRWAPLQVSKEGRAGFTELDHTTTGILFTNSLPEQRYLMNQILLNGSGVAAGDFDGDGWCDLFFAGLDRPSVLYRNLGDWRFSDITESAGVACAGQPSTGTLVADVDGNGPLDLLVSGVGTGARLFLNSGRGKFREATDAWGLRAHYGSTSMAAADMDGDGFLDLYLANYRRATMRDELEVRFKVAVTNGQYQLLAVNDRPVTSPDLVGRYTVDPQAGVLENGEAHVLYRNIEGGAFRAIPWTSGNFLDEDGHPSEVPYDWGLSVAFRDLNGDNAPDLYVCNDFQSPDRIWLNDGHGNFRAIPRLAIRQTSIFSMGVDVADIDRDGQDDIFVADMLSRKHASRQVQLMDRRPMEPPLGEIDNRPQYSRNTLLWNRGNGTYAEIAQLSGLEASEWTWCPIFLDVDLDGYEDLLVGTGHVRDAQNIDISRRIEAIRRERRMPRVEQLNLRRMFKPLEVPNFAFRNRGDLTFEEVGNSWHFNSVKVTQGMALADFDNDGDLDVVANCLNAEPLILRNECARPRIAVRLKGQAPNSRGIGAKIKLLQDGLAVQSQEVVAGGRYLSSDEPMRSFAVAGPDSKVRIEVMWRSGRSSWVENAKANRVYEIFEPKTEPTQSPALQAPPTLFADESPLLNYSHTETAFDDYRRQSLLPHKLSQLGPGVAWFDLDGDGWEDLVIGSGAGGRTGFFQNDREGGFDRITDQPFNREEPADQTGLVGWISTNGARMLLVGSANYEDSSTNRPAAWIYDLKRKSVAAIIPGQPSSVGPVAMADVDGDGALELFVGGRIHPGRFPEGASSRLFRFVSGQWEADAVATETLAQIDLVSGAIWSDLDGDGLPELVLACAAGPLKVLGFLHGEFQDLTRKLGLENLRGLWTSVNVGDFDSDGRLDIVAGNWGRNTRYQKHLTKPIHFFHGDPDREGTVKLVEAYYAPELDKVVPFRDWETLSAVFPFIRSKYGSFTEFSTASVSEFMGDRMQSMIDLQVNTLDSIVLLNRTNRFEVVPLPVQAQVAPIFGLAVGDLDGDGAEDILCTQNLFCVPPLVSRLDGGCGALLRGNNKGGFAFVPEKQSGISVYGEGRGVALCDYDHDRRVDVVAAQNANQTKLYHNRSARPGLRVTLRGSEHNPEAIGAMIRLKYHDGSLGPAREVHAGGGYWSQDASTQVLGLGGEPEAIVVRWPGGSTTVTPIAQDSREADISSN